MTSEKSWKETTIEYNCTFYRKDLHQDGDDLEIYYWVTGKRGTLFICSFTIDQKQEGTKQNKAELKIVQSGLVDTTNFSYLYSASVQSIEFGISFGK